MAQIQFNAQNVAPQAPRGEPLPNAWYNWIITKSEWKPTKNNPNAYYLNMELTVFDGWAKDRKAYHTLNLYHDNATTVQIAESQLSAICHATGVLQLQDTSQLHGRPFSGKVKTSKAEEGYESRNEFSGFDAYKPELAQEARPSTGPSFAPPTAGTQGAIPGGYAPPQQGFAPPVQQPQPPLAAPYAPPVQQQPTWGGPAPTPQAGFAPQAPSTQPYAGGPPTFAPPAPASAPGFAPPQQQPGFQPPQQGYAPPQQGFAPPVQQQPVNPGPTGAPPWQR